MIPKWFSKMVMKGEEKERFIVWYVKGRNGLICLTPGCIRTSATILKNLDESVEPCDDFYQFTCGNYLKETIIPDDKPTIDFGTDISDGIAEQLRIIIEELPKEKELKPFLLVKKYFDACMNLNAIEDTGLKYIKSLLEDLGGWPVLKGTMWNEDTFDWKSTIHAFRKIGLFTNNIVKVYVGQDVKNSTRRLIDIDQATLGLNREYLDEGFENKVVKSYYDYLVDLAVIFGADNEFARKEMRQCVEFEMALANITLRKEERRNVTALTNLMTISELQRKVPSVPWVEYINNIIQVPASRLSPNDTVDVGVPKFLTKLEMLLEKTPKRIQANYLINQAVISAVPYLTKQLRDRQLKYKESSEGTLQSKPRWRECVEEVSSRFDIALGALYVRRYFDEDAKRTVAEIVSNLRSTFMNMLKQLDWMDEATKIKALEKLKAMHSHIAYPEEFRDDKKLEEYYSELKLDSDTLLGMNFQIEKFGQDISFKKLPKLVNRTDWTERSSIINVNAYFNNVENSIQIPVGILQGVFFDNERPHYMNYGSMGFVIGHEITHGFDDRGRQFDKNGELTEWWATKTKETYLERAQCIIDQYSNITSSEVNLNLNGMNTQGENIADNGGLKEAYLAYDSWVKSNGEEARLPGLKYSPKQMFWISAATFWCEKLRPEYLTKQVLTDSHSPSKFRVLVPFGNSEYFAKDFNCPVGSKMNPQHKCHVW